MKCVRGDFCVYIRAINFALDTLPPSIPPSLPQSKTGEELVLKQILWALDTTFTSRWDGRIKSRWFFINEKYGKRHTVGPPASKLT